MAGAGAGARCCRCATTTTTYAGRLADRLRAEGFRADVVDADEPLGARIRKAKLEKLPYVLVVGDDDVANGTVGVNPRGGDGRARRAGRRLRRAPPRPRSPPTHERRGESAGRGATTDLARRDLDRLWAGWRSGYVAAAANGALAAQGSVFRRILDSGLPDEETHIVWRGETVFAILNAYPYTSGHLLVMPYREVRRPRGPRPTTRAAELWATVRAAVAAVKAAYRPDGVNVGLNLGEAAGAGVPDHLHVHVLPRWNADTNFMTVGRRDPGAARVPGRLVGKLRAAWPS